MELNVNATTCIKCGKCVRVCPANIFCQEAAGKVVEVNHPEICIGCGHCVAVCPSSSVIHSDFPAERIHPVDASLLPTPEQMMLLIKSRRSNRAFSSASVPAGMLEQILEAAHRAPTASNQQSVSFTLVTDPDKLKEISAFTIGTFQALRKKLMNPVLKFLLKPILPQVYGYVPTFDRLAGEYAKGNDLILRKATAVILIHTPKGNRFGCQDANLAYQNGSLMAESLGVSQFYTGFVCTAINQDKERRLERLFGVEGKIHAGMALGMPAFKYPNYIDRKEIQATRF